MYFIWAPSALIGGKKRVEEPLNICKHTARMKNLKSMAAAACVCALAACGVVRENIFATDESKLWSMGQELSFFTKYSIDAQILRDGESMLVFSPSHQGRVLTSSYGGENSPSLGWFNREALALRKNRDLRRVNIGGEDAFALGPEGGDSSVFFEQGVLFSEENRRVPEIASAAPWKMVSRSHTQARFECSGELSNALGAKFKVKAEREISLLSRGEASKILGIEIPQTLKMAAFQSMNKLTNIGGEAWSEKHGMLNMGVKSCFNANNTVNTFIPYRPGDASKLGDVVRDNVFDSGEGIALSGERVEVGEQFIRFKCDGRHISGIGVSARRSEGIALSYDDKNSLLTIILYIKPSGNRAYFPVSWRNSQAGFDGDAISVFNNGPVAKNIYWADLFYEISTNSPALNLAAGKSQFHLQRTFHFHGSEYDLDLIAYKLAGISLKQMRIK